MLVGCFAVPAAAAGCWTQFADSVKARNPFGVFLTSGALKAWNFGTWAQRMQPRSYLPLLAYVANHAGSAWTVVTVWAVYRTLLRRSDRRAAVCIALYLGTMLVFFNLYVVHEYYSYANAIFLLAAMGFWIDSLLQSPGYGRAWAGVALLVLAMSTSVGRYLIHYYPMQRDNAPGRPRAAAAIERMTRPGDIILVEGLDWSAELAYQSHRRAIMDAPLDHSHRGSLQAVETAIANAQAQNVTVVVGCVTDQAARVQVLVALLRMNPTSKVYADGCEIYQR